MSSLGYINHSGSWKWLPSPTCHAKVSDPEGGKDVKVRTVDTPYPKSTKSISFPSTKEFDSP
jgi:hypothetical protein